MSPHALTILPMGRINLFLSSLYLLVKLSFQKWSFFHYCVQELHSSWIFALIVHVTPLGFHLFVSFVLLPKKKSGDKCMGSPILFQWVEYQTLLFQEAEHIFLRMCVCTCTFLDGMQNIYS